MQSQSPDPHTESRQNSLPRSPHKESGKHQKERQRQQGKDAPAHHLDDALSLTRSQRSDDVGTEEETVEEQYGKIPDLKPLTDSPSPAPVGAWSPRTMADS